MANSRKNNQFDDYQFDDQEFLTDQDDFDSEDSFAGTQKNPQSKGFGLGKIFLTFTLLFFLLASGVYAGAYLNLFNARQALDFSGVVNSLKGSDNAVVSTVLPFVEWTTSRVADVGGLMQSSIDGKAANETVAKVDEKKASEELKTQEEKLNKQAEAKFAQQSPTNTQNGNGLQSVATELPGAGAAPVVPGANNSNDNKNNTAEELKKIADERQKELNKRAGKLANYYAAMKPKDAVEIMQYLDNNEIIVILGRMEDETAAQILAQFEPERASVISQNILKLYPVPTIVPNTGNV